MNLPIVDPKQVVRLWLKKQWLLNVDNPQKLTKDHFSAYLQQVGGLQVDSVNVLDRAHYLTLWSRFGNYDRGQIDDWIYQDKVAYEYWGHEASILPASFLPISRRRMKDFPPRQWANSAWWKRQETSAASKKRVIARIKSKGRLENSDLEKEIRSEKDPERKDQLKEDKRSLQLLWHAGKIGIAGRTHFRKIFDQSENIYPKSNVASTRQFHDSWLNVALAGNGAVCESHLINYFTTPNLTAAERRQVIDRNLKSKSIFPMQIKGRKEEFYATEEDLQVLTAADGSELPKPTGTRLICPFDSFLWQRARAEDLLDFHYRIEIYVPESKRKFGYYLLPILHEGNLIGRLDPKLHRDQNLLEIRSLHYEPKFRETKKFQKTLKGIVEELADFVGAKDIRWPAKSKM